MQLGTLPVTGKQNSRGKGGREEHPTWEHVEHSSVDLSYRCSLLRQGFSAERVALFFSNTLMLAVGTSTHIEDVRAIRSLAAYDAHSTGLCDDNGGGTPVMGA